MRARAGALVASLLLTVAASLGAGLPAPFQAAQPVAASAYVPDGRIAQGGPPGIVAARRTCKDNDCDLRNLTTDPTDNTPAWSPTGREIAFSRQVGTNYLLHVLDLTTGEVKRVTDPIGDVTYTSDTDPDWSPDGTTITFGHTADDAREIGFVAVHGPDAGTVHILPQDWRPNSDPCKIYYTYRWDPSFSADGSEIAYSVGAPVIVVASVGNPTLDARLSAVAGVDCPGDGVWASSISGHEGERRVSGPLKNASAPAWSPDGTSIAMSNANGAYVVPLGGGSPIQLVGSNGYAPSPADAPGAGMHTGWDPAGAFLVVDVNSNSAPLKYKPDGSGDLDTPNGTHAPKGWAVQCQGASCLTSFTIEKRVDGANGTYPATFHYTGTIADDITIEDGLFTDSGTLTRRVKAGRATATEGPNLAWPLTSIECDAPGAQVNLTTRTVSVDVAEGAVVTCTFLSDLGVPTESLYTPDPTRCIPPLSKLLSVTLRGQETDMWCWAASTQMVMEFLGRFVSQGVEANNQFGRTDCTNDPVPGECIHGGFPDFAKYGFINNVTPAGTALSWQQVKEQIGCRNKPFVFAWHWVLGGGHAMVARGYRTQANVAYVEVDDPWPPNVGTTGNAAIITYASFVSSKSDHSHWNDWYDVTLIGP